MSTNPIVEKLTEKMLSAINMRNMLSFQISRLEIEQMAEAMVPLVLAALQVNEAHQRTLHEHSVSAHYGMDVAWAALNQALKDLG